MYRVIMVDEKNGKEFEAKVCENLADARLYCKKFDKYLGKYCYHKIEKINN